MSREFIEGFEKANYEAFFKEYLSRNSRKMVGSAKWWRYIESKQSRGVKEKKYNYYSIEQEGVKIQFK